MVAFTSLPVVGKTSDGKLATLVVSKDNNRSVITTNAQSIGTSPTTGTPYLIKGNPSWDKLSVTAIHSENGKTVAIGNGIDSSGKSRELAWTNLTGTWVIGLSPILSSSKIGMISFGDSFLVADSAQSTVFKTDFKYGTTPASNFIDKLPASDKVATVPSVSILSNNGTILVAATPDRVGTWTTSASISPGGDWTHQVGEAELVPTNHKSTSYTFPGSSATNIQRIGAYHNGDKPPETWIKIDEKADGYYGVVKSPIFKSKWIKPGS